VRILQDFYLGKYEVTQEEWQKVMGKNPSYFSRSGGGRGVVRNILDAKLKRFPVESVSWDDCQAFVRQLNEKDQEPGWVYRLPTAREWEYACRGGPLADRSASAFDYYFDTGPTNTLRPGLANYKGSGLKRPRAVGSYRPNALGLHDMHGNVGETCLDDPDSNTGHMGRGGSWHAEGERCKARFPGTLTSKKVAPEIWRGLRVARVPAASKK
jgi:formylglycine-generating enzyme required for sulfatase activity